MNYKKLDLKCGLEIHQQLNTKHKLFCDCSTETKQKNPLELIKRKQHPVASELGEVDVAAQYEFLRDRKFNYQVFTGEDCLVETDSEPIHPLNQEALEVVLQIALMFNCTIPEEIHIMRKNVIDGSNTSGFQRTVVVGLDGFLEYKGEKIGICHVSLEEDASAIVGEENGNVTYKLNRLGIPLVEIGTDVIEGFTPEEVQDIAYMIGMICRSTGRVKRGIGTIRQDLNISIKGGQRIEIKGVQELGLLSKIIELEVNRQLSLPKVEKEVRAANEDGTTRFTRPMPGAARMYPETDVPPLRINEKLINEIKNNLPEPLNKKIIRFKEELNLSEELSKQIVRSDYSDLFERFSKKFNIQPSIIANIFVNTLKDLKKRENLPVEDLTDEDFEKVLSMLEKGKIVKESVPDVLKFRLKNPSVKMEEIIEKMGLKTLTEEELTDIVRDTIKENKDKPLNKIIGIVMSKVRGKIDSQTVVKIVKKEFEKIY